MPVINVEMFAGRPLEKRKELVEKLTQTYVDVLGGRPQAVHIIIQDVEKDHWAVGGELCSDLFPDT